VTKHARFRTNGGPSRDQFTFIDAQIP